MKSKQRVEPLLRIDWGCLDGFANITHCNLHFTVQVKGICTINITVYSTQGNATLYKGELWHLCHKKNLKQCSALNIQKMGLYYNIEGSKYRGGAFLVHLQLQCNTKLKGSGIIRMLTNYTKRIKDFFFS